ncbi:MAG: hypothetical protein IJ460_04255 [Clostridia bacterium]|nr:hypothetical protein [Clostridia bacterium]
MKGYSFIEAVPVWEKKKDKEMNYNLIFRCVVPKTDNAIIALTASNMYQMFVNGSFAAEGPARAGHGCYRVDEIDISRYLTKENNIVSIYVDSYYVRNFYLIRQPGFLCAEVISDGKVICATGKSGFEAKYHGDRIRKCPRYSYQRTFAESYRYDGSYKDFETKTDVEFEPVELVAAKEKSFIERGVPYPSYKFCPMEKVIARGEVEFVDEPINPIRNRVVEQVHKNRGFEIKDMEILNSDEADKGIYTKTSSDTESADIITVGANQYVISKLPGEKSGFITFDIEAEVDTELIINFDEILDENGDVSTHRFASVQSVIVWFLKAGKYSIITNEPYSGHYFKITNKSQGNITVRNFGVTEFAFDIEPEPLYSGNEKLDKIYAAAVETFKQNTLDIYMDCPSRERAGWLCDSFFTSRVEYALTGKSLVEKNFLENFIMAKGLNDIEWAMLPMCYPSDTIEHNHFIPNWAMWYVIELAEYLERSGDRELVDYAKEKMIALAEYFEDFENLDGLLENLQSWVFLEWSKANEFTQDVNYPSNMLYAQMLECLAKLYDEPRYAEKAAAIKAEICRQSYFDGFFHDHAVRHEDGTLEVVKDDITETCQYYAFFTGTAAADAYPELWSTLLNDFGPDRAAKGLWEDIYPSNAFIGYYLRLELLAKAKEDEKLLENIEGFFTYMADTTGTLWENKTATASCNHGFTSHVIVWLDKIFKENK